MAEDQSEPTETSSVPSQRRWRRRAILCALLLTVVTHPWWLRAIGEYLAAKEEPVSSADVVLVLDGDHRLQLAAQMLVNESVSEVWLVEREPSYAEEAGILPTRHDVAVRELVSLGVPEKQIRVLRGRARECDDDAQVVAQEMAGTPTKTLIILCKQMDGRNMRLVFSKLLGHKQASHFSVLGLRDDEFDQRNWWRSRSGWKETFTATSDLVFTKIIGVEPHPGWPRWDPDAYERQLVSDFGEAACHGE